jgi:hypothetical protein
MATGNAKYGSLHQYHRLPAIAASSGQERETKSQISKEPNKFQKTNTIGAD